MKSRNGSDRRLPTAALTPEGTCVDPVNSLFVEGSAALSGSPGAEAVTEASRKSLDLIHSIDDAIQDAVDIERSSCNSPDLIEVKPSLVAPDSPLETTIARSTKTSQQPKRRLSPPAINRNNSSNCSDESMSGKRAQVESNFDGFSEALFKLSFHDRNSIHEEIHGVSCLAPEETPQLLKAALFQLCIELREIKEKAAFDRAQELQQMDTSVVIYVNTDAFRLRFLRTELFDVKKAAVRLVRYLDLVYDVYGIQALTRPIQLSDFSREEMTFLRSGAYQILPYRDRSGRRLLCIVTNNRDEVSAQIRLKILIYLWVVAGEDVESQRKGMVVICYTGPVVVQDETEEGKRNQQQKFHSSRVTTHAVVGQAVPMRATAIHFCLPNNPFLLVVKRIYGLALGAYSSRVLFHLGESIELRYKLQTYGIPVELIPSTDTGNVKHVNLKQWIKLREFLEKQRKDPINGHISSDSDADAMDYEYLGTKHQYRSASNQQQQQQQQQSAYFSQQFQLGRPYFSLQQQPRIQQLHQQIVECPGSTDVIFRRGKSMTYHPGNVMFQSLIESRLEAHSNANQTGKLAIVLELIQYIREVKGGRFLTWDSGHNWWLDMNMIPSATTNGMASYPDSTGINSNGRNMHTTITSQDLEIQSKVNYAFRDFKKRMKTHQNLQTSKSSTYVFERQDGHERKRIKGGTSARGCAQGCVAWGGCEDSGNVVSDGD